jgi:cytochrome b subunit of formate dehydrogenase
MMRVQYWALGLIAAALVITGWVMLFRLLMAHYGG